MTNNVRPFHLAIPVTDIGIAHKFYKNILGCTVGRRSENWIDFNFFGHQVVAHYLDDTNYNDVTNIVDGENVPSRHFGIIMQLFEWKNMLKMLKEKQIKFILKPQIRFKGEIGEQYTFFILDPFGNALEFKAFSNENHIFAVND